MESIVNETYSKLNLFFYSVNNKYPTENDWTPLLKLFFTKLAEKTKENIAKNVIELLDDDSDDDNYDQHGNSYNQNDYYDQTSNYNFQSRFLSNGNDSPDNNYSSSNHNNYNHNNNFSEEIIDSTVRDLEIQELKDDDEEIYEIEQIHEIEVTDENQVEMIIDKTIEIYDSESINSESINSEIIDSESIESEYIELESNTINSKNKLESENFTYENDSDISDSTESSDTPQVSNLITLYSYDSDSSEEIVDEFDKIEEEEIEIEDEEFESKEDNFDRYNSDCSEYSENITVEFEMNESNISGIANSFHTKNKGKKKEKESEIKSDKELKDDLLRSYSDSKSIYNLKYPLKNKFYSFIIQQLLLQQFDYVYPPEVREMLGLEANEFVLCDLTLYKKKFIAWLLSLLERSLPDDLAYKWINTYSKKELDSFIGGLNCNQIKKNNSIDNSNLSSEKISIEEFELLYTFIDRFPKIPDKFKTQFLNATIYLNSNFSSTKLIEKLKKSYTKEQFSYLNYQLFLNKPLLTNKRSYTVSRKFLEHKDEDEDDDVACHINKRNPPNFRI